jgi:hypothetical protein
MSADIGLKRFGELVLDLFTPEQLEALIREAHANAAILKGTKLRRWNRKGGAH